MNPYIQTYHLKYHEIPYTVFKVYNKKYDTNIQKQNKTKRQPTTYGPLVELKLIRNRWSVV